MELKTRNGTGRLAQVLAGLFYLAMAVAAGVVAYSRGRGEPRLRNRALLAYQERKPFDTGGFLSLLPVVDAWPANATLE